MSVAPRSQNPHLLPQEVKTISRAELFPGKDGGDALSTDDDETLRFLDGLLARSLEYERPRKRRKVEDESYEYIVQEPQCAFETPFSIYIQAKIVNKCLGSFLDHSR